MSARWLCALTLLAALLALAGCDQRLQPGFPHRAHLLAKECGETGQPDCPTCASCHAGVVDDAKGARPEAQDCRRCHQEDTPRLLDSLRLTSVKQTPIIFSHAQHQALPELAGGCVKCHGGIATDGVDGGVFPAMAGCHDCHQEAVTRGPCNTCHRPADLRTLVPQTSWRHDLGFLRNHGREATQSQGVCNQCHAERDCAACHDERQPLGVTLREPLAVERELIHRADFLSRHSIDAGLSPAKCVRCHSVSFCDGCHVQRGISGNRVGSLNPHPIGWVGPDTSGPNFHGKPARRDIVACASCHDQGPATNCIRCHTVGGPGGNPHPGGWSSLRSPSAPMCRYCHEP
jgi:hypothetical protein